MKSHLGLSIKQQSSTSKLGWSSCRPANRLIQAGLWYPFEVCSDKSIKAFWSVRFQEDKSSRANWLVGCKRAAEKYARMKFYFLYVVVCLCFRQGDSDSRSWSHWASENSPQALMGKHVLTATVNRMIELPPSWQTVVGKHGGRAMPAFWRKKKSNYFPGWQFFMWSPAHQRDKKKNRIWQ